MHKSAHPCTIQPQGLRSEPNSCLICNKLRQNVIRTHTLPKKGRRVAPSPCRPLFGALRAPSRAQLAFRGLQCRLEERMFTATADLILPSTTTGSFPRPRWFDVSMWGRPLDTCMLDYPKQWRRAQAKTRKPVKFGTCCSQVMALFLDIHTPHYKDKRQVIWDMAEAMNKELLALRDAGCRCIQIEEPTFHFMANTYGKDHEEVKFMVDAFNREVQGLDDVELWIHTCWGNPNMQRVMEDTGYANSLEIYLERCRGDVWTLEMKDRNQRDIELFEPFKNDLKKKICIGVVSHRTLQADRPEDVAGEIRKALRYIPPERLIVSSDCGFGRQGCNREIAFYKASAIAQGANIVRRELGLPATYVPATDPILQIDVVPGR